MFKVQFFEATDEGEEIVGSIHWDGKKLVTDNEVLGEILTSPISVPLEKKIYYPDKDPAGWLKSLSKKYNGSRFWASAPMATKLSS